MRQEKADENGGLYMTEWEGERMFVNETVKDHQLRVTATLKLKVMT